MGADINIGELLMQYFCLLFALCVHEAGHAAMSNYCGDPTARLLGRLTLNPVRHADPLGTVILPLVMFITGIPYLFGWAKPVPFNPRNLNNMRRDPVFIALAGPGTNLLMALAAAIVLRILVLFFGLGALAGFFDMLMGAHAPILPDAPNLVKTLGMILGYFFMINSVLMLFNIIPVPPLDGHYVLDFFLPPSGQRVLQQIGPFGIIIAIMVAQPWLGFAMPRVLHTLLWLILYPNNLG